MDYVYSFFQAGLDHWFGIVTLLVACGCGYPFARRYVAKTKSVLLSDTSTGKKLFWTNIPVVLRGLTAFIVPVLVFLLGLANGLHPKSVEKANALGVEYPHITTVSPGPATMTVVKDWQSPQTSQGELEFVKIKELKPVEPERPLASVDAEKLISERIGGVRWLSGEDPSFPSLSPRKVMEGEAEVQLTYLWYVIVPKTDPETGRKRLGTEPVYTETFTLPEGIRSPIQVQVGAKSEVTGKWYVSHPRYVHMQAASSLSPLEQRKQKWTPKEEGSQEEKPLILHGAPLEEGG
ncbi:hypothetical protein COU76_06065 [Candidatus Peregrinibacteria bacterium CG10_big_fil_rev_8_21_14_0_10_49_10]|nr:MAG: hypothetical protein COU76_06065 [Candidatus Peregrinibacteria bacterium CG10_big_fil_rev_8_21_14_0_10_49_10]